MCHDVWGVEHPGRRAAGEGHLRGSRPCHRSIHELRCTTFASDKGKQLDYIIVPTTHKAIIATCEVVRCTPCGTHLGVRTTLHAEPASVMVNDLRRPLSIEPAVDHFTIKGQIMDDRATKQYLMPSVAESRSRLYHRVLKDIEDTPSRRLESISKASALDNGRPIASRPPSTMLYGRHAQSTVYSHLRD